MIKTPCGLCLALCLFFATGGALAAPAPKSDTSYTTAQILTYLQVKVFNGVTGNIPNVKGSVGARHSIWQTGAADSITDFVYSDYSNTRLEAKIEVPIFDLGYLRNRDREKLAHRADVMKGLSRILAAQKTVKTIENQIATMWARYNYTNEQIKLKLANRSDLFPIENEIYARQPELHEAQSVLEQRVIDLSMLAGKDWLEAYDMIIKWNGVLFDRGKK